MRFHKIIAILLLMAVGVVAQGGAGYQFFVHLGETVRLEVRFRLDANCNAVHGEWTTPNPPTLGSISQSTIDFPVPSGHGRCTGVVIPWDVLYYTRTAPASAGQRDYFSTQWSFGSSTIGHAADLTLDMTEKQGGAAGCPCNPDGSTSVTHTGNAAVGDPINVATGNVFYETTDYDSGGADRLAFTRYYNGRAEPGHSSLGVGWRSNYARYLFIFSASSATVERPDGQILSFTGSDGTWTSDSDIDITLTQVGQGYAIKTIDGTTENYSAPISQTALLSSIVARDGYTQSLTYDDDRQLISVTDSYGRSLAFTYSADRLQTVTAPDGLVVTYGYRPVQKLSTVSYSTSPATSQSYAYPQSSSSYLLNGVTDENGNVYQTWTYDPNSRGSSSRRGTGANAQTTTTSYGDDIDNTVTVSGPLGRNDVYRSRMLQGAQKIVSISNGSSTRLFTYDPNGYLASASDWNGNVTGYVNNSRGLPTTITEPTRTTTTAYDPALNFPTRRSVANASGVTESLTRWNYNTRGQVLSRCEADPAIAAAASYSCGASANAPVGVRQFSATYCEQAGVATGNCPRIGLLLAVDGPRTDVPDKTIYTYYQATDISGCASSGGACHRIGQIYKVTNALGQATTYLTYDLSGRVTRVSDANGTLIDFTYSPRGWLLTQTVRANTNGTASSSDAITAFIYDKAGQVLRVTQPEGAYLAYLYDSAHRLTDITDNLGNHIHYALDGAGNRISETTSDAGNTVTRAITRQYDQFSRLTSLLNATNVAVQTFTNPADAPPAGITYTNGYDGNGNDVYSVDGNGVGTERLYDPLNRLVKTLEDHTGRTAATQDTTTRYAYDTRDSLVSVTDPNGLATAYTYDGLNNLTRLQSPDTGTTRYTYDAAGNRISQTDARGVLSSYSYDALNRLTGVTYPTSALNVAYRYDQPDSITGCADSAAIGRLTTMTDNSGSTAYCYDRRGNLTKASSTLGSRTLVTQYLYDAADRLDSVIYPSGDAVIYERDATGRAVAAIFQPVGSNDRLFADGFDGTHFSYPLRLLNNVKYLPFGPATAITFGNGRTLSKTYDKDYAISRIHSSDPNGLSLEAQVDPLSNLIRAASGAEVRNYVYDPLYRLTEAKDSNSSVLEAYNYNPTGDRLSKTFNGRTESYTYSSPLTSHRLLSAGGITRGYDANGNTTRIGSATLTFDDSNRLSQAANVAYFYNGVGQRVVKRLGATDTLFTYSSDSMLLAESTSPFTRSTEYIWLAGTLVGVIKAGNLYYVETDQLGTPRVVAQPSRSSGDKVVWKWDSTASAFGENVSDNDPDHDGTAFAFNFRFPGQYYDAESGHSYNYFRDYESITGRYVQSDPIGLAGGTHTYEYVGSNPLSTTDPMGLASNKHCIGTYTAAGAACGGATGYVTGGLIFGLGSGAACTLVAPGVGTVGCGATGAISGSQAGLATGIAAGAAAGDLLGNLMCRNDTEDEEHKKGCQDLKNSILNTCAGLPREKVLACYAAADVTYRQCMGYE